jgi:hypothetical protein
MPSQSSLVQHEPRYAATSAHPSRLRLDEIVGKYHKCTLNELTACVMVRKKQLGAAKDFPFALC